MKTTDLIPLILLELNESDKYGFELTKAIETKSSGKIVIKQPTLYTILKKLEKSKFITSYWEDSEIGGKRHYYKITENGKALISTLPNYSTLLSNISNDEADDAEVGQEFDSQNSNIMADGAPNEEQQETEINAEPEQVVFEQELKESALPSEEIFKDDSVDTLTEHELNSMNSSILKDDKVNNEQQFAANESVSKFTETKSAEISDEYKTKLKTVSNSTLFGLEPATPKEDEEKNVKFVEYSNIKSAPNYIYSNKMAKNMLYRIISSSAYLLFMLIFTSIIVGFTGSGALYYLFLIIGILALVLFPAIYAFNYDKFKQKCQNKQYKLNLKKQIIFALSFMLAVLLMCFIVNLCMGVSFFKIFASFANFYAPLLISSCVCMDILFSYLFVFKNLKD